MESHAEGHRSLELDLLWQRLARLAGAVDQQLESSRDALRISRRILAETDALVAASRRSREPGGAHSHREATAGVRPAAPAADARDSRRSA